MVDKIITSSKLDTVFIQNKLKYSFALSLFFSLVSCDSTDIKFQNKAENGIKTNISAYNSLEYGLVDKTSTQCIKRIK